MNRTHVLASAVLACLATAPAWAQNPAQDRQIEQAAQQVMQQYGIPGMAIGITDHGTRHFYQYGVASRETGQPVSNKTLFEVGSISKTFTATLAAWAQAQGKLKLTDTIDTYLPQLHDSRLGKIELLHLATHTAGGFPLQVPDTVQNNTQLMAYFKAWQPQSLPGVQRHYANPSIGLLGLIAAQSLGQPFARAMEQGLFPALGLSATFINVPKDKQALYAQGYDKQDAPVRLTRGMLADEAYGVKTSSHDLLSFLEANLQSGTPTSPLQQALKATHSGYFRFGPTTQALVWEYYAPPLKPEDLLAGNSNVMAFTPQPVTPLNPPEPAPAGAWINKTGSTSGFGGYVAFIPDRQLGIVILANRNYPNPDRVRLAQQIVKALDRP